MHWAAPIATTGAPEASGRVYEANAVATSCPHHAVPTDSFDPYPAPSLSTHPQAAAPCQKREGRAGGLNRSKGVASAYDTDRRGGHQLHAAAGAQGCIDGVLRGTAHGSTITADTTGLTH